MADFTAALEHVLRHEGGWVCDPDDPGAETNFGVSMYLIAAHDISAAELGVDPLALERAVTDFRAHAAALQRGETPPPLQPTDVLKPMTREGASNVYRRLWWEAFGYGQLVEQTMANKLLDTCVNIGRRPHLWAQECCNQLGALITVDGVLGPASYEALNAVPTLPWLTLFSKMQADYYRRICAVNPKLRKFLEGNWLKRAAWLGN